MLKLNECAGVADFSANSPQKLAVPKIDFEKKREKKHREIRFFGQFFDFSAKNWLAEKSATPAHSVG